MEQFIYLVQIVIAVLLVIVILIQQKGTGLGSTFGSQLSFYRTKRGAEKLLFNGTIFLAILFIVFSFVGILVS